MQRCCQEEIFLLVFALKHHYQFKKNDGAKLHFALQTVVPFRRQAKEQILFAPTMLGNFAIRLACKQKKMLKASI